MNLRLEGLTSNPISGPDRISEIIVKLCEHALFLPIKIIFNWSLNSGNCPSIWKLSYVIPIHEVGIKSSVTNYL